MRARPDCAERHTLQERAHRRVGVRTERIDQRAPSPTLTFDRVDDRHVARIRGPLEAMVFPDHHLARAEGPAAVE